LPTVTQWDDLDVDSVRNPAVDRIFCSHGMMGNKPSGWFFVAVERPDEWCGWNFNQLGI
jgi:hypothetical protein